PRPCQGAPALRIFSAGLLPRLFSSPRALGDAQRDRRILDLDVVALAPTALWIDAFPRRQIELPQVGCTGEDAAFQLPIRERGPLVGTVPLISANVAAGQVDQEDELIPYLNIGHLTFTGVVEGRYRDPFPRARVPGHRRRPPQSSSATAQPERPFGPSVERGRCIARAWAPPGPASAGGSHGGPPSGRPRPSCPHRLQARAARENRRERRLEAAPWPCVPLP